MLLLSDSCIEVNSGGYQVNMVSDAGWNTVLFASEMVVASVSIGVDRVLGLEKRLGFFNSGVDLEPS